jgi:hypothetical protein
VGAGRTAVLKGFGGIGEVKQYFTLTVTLFPRTQSSIFSRWILPCADAHRDSDFARH